MVGVTFKLSSFDLDKLKQVVNSIKSYSQLQDKIYKKNIKVIFLPKKCRHYCLLRSPHIDKCSREQFKIINHRVLICFKHIFFSKEEFFNFIRIPSGVLVKVIKK